MGLPTPGPWYYDSLGDHAWILDQEGNYLFEVVHKDDAGKIVPPVQQEANGKMAALAPDMAETLKAQHNAIDTLFAMLIEVKPGFYPSKSGEPWAAVQKAKIILDHLERG